MTGEKAEMLAERCVQSIDEVLAKHTALQAQALRQASAVTAAKPAGPPAFDPFAFSAVSILARKGREALLQRLGEIASADHLREFAMAQHIAIDQDLTDANELRAAIVVGTERRIAARRAAAS
jgi:uncharacterized tellurite resistance protein B-like protein